MNSVDCYPWSGHKQKREASCYAIGGLWCLISIAVKFYVALRQFIGRYIVKRFLETDHWHVASSDFHMV
jgi:hypothetical protein